MMYKRWRRPALRTLGFLANFATARGVAFAGPLTLAYLLPTALYGEVEYALGLANVLALAIGLGVVSGVPNAYLVLKEKDIEDVIATIVAVTAFLAVLLAIIAGASGAPSWQVLGAGAIASAGVQRGAATYLRVTGRRLLASWFDNAALHLMVVIALLAMIIAPKAPSAPLQAILAICAVFIAIAASTIVAKLKKSHYWDRMYRFNELGFSIMLNSVVQVWLATSPRFYFGTFLSMEALAEYAICFRIAGVMVVAYQAYTTSIFPRLYTMRTRRFDKSASAYILLIILLGGFVASNLPFIIESVYGSAIDAEAKRNILTLFPLVAMQMVFWIITAFLDMRINRFRLARQAFQLNIVLAGISMAVIFSAHYIKLLDPLTLTSLVVAQVALQATIYLVLLWRRKLPCVGIGACIGLAYLATLILEGYVT